MCGCLCVNAQVRDWPIERDRKKRIEKTMRHNNVVISNNGRPHQLSLLLNAVVDNGH